MEIESFYRMYQFRRMPIWNWIAAIYMNWASVEPGASSQGQAERSSAFRIGPMLKRIPIATLLFSSVLLAQTAPNASGPPESVLAGIDPYHTTIADIQKMYGLQEAVFAIPPNPYPPGTKLYKWGRLTVTLKVLTEPSAQGEAIRAIEVEGEGEPGDKAINKTGRGLRLGAKLARSRNSTESHL